MEKAHRQVRDLEETIPSECETVQDGRFSIDFPLFPRLFVNVHVFRCVWKRF